MKTLITLILLVVGWSHSANENSFGTIIVEMINFKNDNGKVRVSLFDSEDGFPEEYLKAHTYYNQSIEDKKAQVIFENIPYGDYAIGFLHDENLDTKLNTNWLGIPKEGIAASNNVKGLFGPPGFADARFVLNADTLTLIIEMVYM